MEVILENSETYLESEIAKAKRQNILYRCLYIKVSELCSFNLDTFRMLLREALSFYKAKLFLCSDSDIFLMTQGVPVKEFREIKENIIPQTFVGESTTDVINEIDIFNNSQCIIKLLKEKQAIIDKDKDKDGAIEFRDSVIKKPSSFKKFNKKDTEKIQELRVKREHLSILVIDDDPVTTKLVRNVIEKKYKLSENEDIVDCKSALTAREGIEKYAIQCPDVLFLDIGLPDISGKSVLNAILSIDPYAYVVMLSGQSHRSNVVQCIQQGAKGFIGKPFNINQLLHYIGQCPKGGSPLIQSALCRIS